MTASQLLADLRAAGVTLTARDGRLAYSAPVGVMTDEIKASLTHQKSALLDHLDPAADRVRSVVLSTARSLEFPRIALRYGPGAVGPGELDWQRFVAFQPLCDLIDAGLVLDDRWLAARRAERRRAA